jgi:hypothetical protein
MSWLVPLELEEDVTSDNSLTKSRGAENRVQTIEKCLRMQMNTATVAINKNGVGMTPAEITALGVCPSIKLENPQLYTGIRLVDLTPN